MRDFFTANGISYEPVVFEKADEVLQLMTQEDVIHNTTDKSGLAAQKN